MYSISMNPRFHSTRNQRTLSLTVPFQQTCTENTICQVASGNGRAGVSVIRVSGKDAWRVADSMTKGKMDSQKINCMQLCKLYEPENGELLDLKCFVVFFKAPKSFTGEDVVEFHVHGSPVLVSDALKAMQLVKGVRLAEPGEFSRRAFLNGKMDLTQVEALADLIHSETRQQRKQALRQLQGDLGVLYLNWANKLTRCLAHVEAVLDFSESEDDVGDLEIQKAVVPKLLELITEINDHLLNHCGERLRSGLHVTLLGAPNAGKSSLLNRLAKKQASIVSRIPGTTRDVIEVALDLNGWPLLLADTAGLRSSNIDEIEQEGMRRALERATQTDVKLVVFDGTQPFDASIVELIDENTIVVINKSDLPLCVCVNEVDALLLGKKYGSIVACSSLNESGILALVNALSNEAETRFRTISEHPVVTRDRHRAHLTECLEHCHAFESVKFLRVWNYYLEWMQLKNWVLSAEELRLAVVALGKITGRIEVEDLLDIIFRDFCIGK